jgi:hypothetical protein
MDAKKTHSGGVQGEMSAANLVKKGSIMSSGVSLIAVILALVAMGNILPRFMIPLSIVAISVAFLSRGGSIAARFPDLLPETSRQRSDVSKLGVGLSVEMAGGIIAGILGILALLNIMPLVFAPAALLVFGITMIVASGVVFWFDSLMTGRPGEYGAHGVTGHEMIMASGGLEFVLGLAAFVLGIMSLAGISSVLMTNVGLLSVGFSELITGTAMSARMWSYAPHTT